LFDNCIGRVKKPAKQKVHRGLGTNREVSVAEYYFEHKHVPKDVDEDEERTHWHPEVENHILPSSDVLSAVHRSAAKFFAKSGRKKHLRFMDETALLAFGMLLEETMKEKLGENGYLAFLEEDDDLREAEDGTDEEEGEDSNVQESESDTESTDSSATMSATATFSRDDYLTDSDGDIE